MNVCMHVCVCVCVCVSVVNGYVNYIYNINARLVQYYTGQFIDDWVVQMISGQK